MRWASSRRLWRFWRRDAARSRGSTIRCCSETRPEGIGEAYSLYEYDDISELKRLEELDPSRFRWTGVDRDDRLEQRILWRIRKSLQLAAPNP